jgi:GxxExxY protein
MALANGYQMIQSSSSLSDPSERTMVKPYVKPEYPHSALTARIIACAQEVHRTLGPGFEEVFYQRALEKELRAASLECEREVWITVHYKGAKLGRKRVDFVVDVVMIETKAKAALEDVAYIQTLSYLKASGYEVGLLINFGAKTLEVKRLINTKR